MAPEVQEDSVLVHASTQGEHLERHGLRRSRDSRVALQVGPCDPDPENAVEDGHGLWLRNWTLGRVHAPLPTFTGPSLLGSWRDAETIPWHSRMEYPLRSTDV